MAKGRVKPRAFQPDRSNVTSVYRVRGLTVTAIWRLGDTVAAHGRDPARARAEVTVADVRDVGLEVDPDDVPPRHAAITGWPTAKDEWKLLAQQLAAKATLCVRELDQD